MTKTFKEIREEYKKTSEENTAKFKQGMKANKEKTKLEKTELKDQWDGKKAEYVSTKQEIRDNRPAGYSRTKSILVNGFALWLAIPAIVVILLIVLFAGVGLWDWFIGLFS